MSKIREGLAASAHIEVWAPVLLPYLTILDYNNGAFVGSMKEMFQNWTTPGHLSRSVPCTIGHLCVHIMMIMMGIPLASAAKTLSLTKDLAVVIRDLILGEFSWVHIMQSGWPVFALIAWCAKLIAPKIDLVYSLSLPTLPASLRWGVVATRARLRDIPAEWDKLTIAPYFWRRLAAVERSLFDAKLLARVEVRSCADGMYCDGERSPNRYTCGCERVFPRPAAAAAAAARRPPGSGLCVVTAHHKVPEVLDNLQDLMTASFWTLSSILNHWYAHLHKGTFDWFLGRTYWCKVRIIREMLARRPGCTWMAWIDSDAYFATTESMEAVAAAHGDVDILLPQLSDDRGSRNVTAHFMLFRVNHVVRRFFDLIWDLPRKQPEIAGQFLEERFHDQSVINLVLNGEVEVDLGGLRVGHLRNEDFGAYNSRMVVHEGGLKYEAFRLLLLNEVLDRVCKCKRCGRSVLWRIMRHWTKNSTC